jgi:5,10-methylene-tetrahydrofolate dehydrogenase/methenyl tetrahydrofolate cyclohydrolase
MLHKKKKRLIGSIATYKAASDWINGHLTVVDGGTSTAKPLLICGDNDFSRFTAVDILGCLCF